MDRSNTFLDNFYQKLQNQSLRFIDLSHNLHSKIPTWSGTCGYKAKNLLNYGDDLFRVQEVTLLAGAGTHIDAPSHLFPGHLDVASIAIKDLFVPVCIVDIRDSVACDPQYSLSIADIERYQEKYGPVVEGAVVLALTGWNKYWETPSKYQNLDSHQVMRFPKINVEAIISIAERLKGVGIDTLSPDGGDISKGFPVHDLILGQGGYILENLTNLEHMPPAGGYLMVSPLKITEGTESPVRVFGLVEKV